MNVAILTALAEPNRLRIVEYLKGHPCSVGELSLQLVIRQPQVSMHLKILSEAGWVEARPRAQQRIYQLHRESFEDLEGWLGTFRRYWETNYQRLDALLAEMKEDDDEA